MPPTQDASSLDDLDVRHGQLLEQLDALNVSLEQVLETESAKKPSG